jgi:tetratricopeptide (TPR) repeat protein
MKRISPLIGLLLFAAMKLTFGQASADQAIALGKQGVKLEEEGKYMEAIKLFEQAQKLDPEMIDYPYEIGYCYVQLKEYKKAIEVAEKLITHKYTEDAVYELLGNAYDAMGDREKAFQAYEEGLKKFPNSGRLYLELGVMQKGKENITKALNYYEKGIEVEPKFPSNYYWAAKIYCNSSEAVWGMIYGEIFMNLERNSKRTAEISKLLYDTYKRQITFTSDTSYTVSFSKFNTMYISGDKDPAKIKLPFGVGVYEPTLMIAMVNEKSIDMNSLDRIRKNFVEAYYANGRDKDFPNVLFEYQQKIDQAGHMEAYDHWILMEGDEPAFVKWQSENQKKWDDFVVWFGNNRLKLDQAHKFFSKQY